MLVSVCPPDTVNVVYVTCSLHVNFQRWLMSSGWGWVPSETCVSLCNHRLAQPAVIIVFHGQWGGDLWKDSPHCYEVSAWLGDWNLAADDHKNNHTKNFLLRWSVIVSVPCHIWRLSQPAPGQVSPPHPARYQTLETNRGKRKRWVRFKFQQLQSHERNATFWWFSSWKAFFRVNMVKLHPHELMLLMLAWRKIKENYKCFFSLIKITLIRDSNFPFSHGSYIICVFTTIHQLIKQRCH